MARVYGVHSAMPMFKALKACPDAVVIRPNMAKYSEVGQQVRALMRDVTPLVEPLSIDEAFLDLTGTERLHKQTPAETMAKLCNRIKNEIGISASVGLSHNKFLAKLSSDFDKPRGFSVIGKAETLSLIADLPLSKIWGVGKVFDNKLKRDGFRTVSHIQQADEKLLMKRYGDMGLRLARLCRGEDARQVESTSKAKSISAETTFEHDISDIDSLHYHLWVLCEKVSLRTKHAGIEGKVVTLKLKSADFKTKTRRKTLNQPSQLAEILYQEGCSLLSKEVDGTSYRLIGIGFSDLHKQDDAPVADLFETESTQIDATERAMDKVRDKFGTAAIQKGRSFAKPKTGA
jgi:DNA polymerase-4